MATVNNEEGVPVPLPTKNLLRSLNVYLPWDTLGVNQSFFLPGASVADRKSVWVAASRRGIKIRSEWRTEGQGYGLRVWRTA